LADWFEGLSFTHECDRTTILAGPVVDQTALYGFLRNVCDLSLLLISIIPLEKGEHVELPSHDPASTERLAGRSAAQAGTARWNGVFSGQTTGQRHEWHMLGAVYSC
jgi:hypothetical protein